jgi:protein TonB
MARAHVLKEETKMFTRLLAAVSLGAVVTGGLLLTMQLLISKDDANLGSHRGYRFDEFTRVERERIVEIEQSRPQRPPEPPAQPQRPVTDLPQDRAGTLSVSFAEPQIDGSFAVRRSEFGAADGEYLPIVKVAPVYPTRALARRLEGHVLVEFSVTENGAVKDVVVIESTADIFEQPAIDAVMKFKYKPRVVDGQAVEVHGVRNKIMFDLAMAAG